MAPIIHTSLESFLLLRALHPYEEDPYLPSFERASDSLASDGVLLQSGQLDTGRLQPEALKHLYLNLLKEQAKLEAPGGSDSPSKDTNPRKRKLSSPPLESLEEASTYASLLPKLVDRLYNQYKEHTIKAIEEEEGQFRSLQKEIEALELHTSEARAARPGSQGVPPISALLRETEDSAPPQRQPDATTNGVQDGIHAPPGNLHVDIYKPLPQAESADNGPPYLPPPPAPPAQGYPLSSSGMDRRASAQAQRPSASPHLTQAPLPQTERSSASPIILPPPKGMVRSSGSPPMPSPSQTHYPPPRQHSGQHPPPRHQSYYYDSAGYPISYPAYAQSPVPIYHPHGGNMQPYHMPTAHAAHTSHYGGQPYQSPASSQHSGYYGTQGQYPATTQTPYTHTASQYHEKRTPSHLSTSRTPKLSPIVTSTSSTKWKKVDPAVVPYPPVSPTRPQSRDISPISEPVSDLDNQTPDKSAVASRSKIQADSHDHSAHDQRSSRGRKGRNRGTGTRGRRGRAGSMASSTVAESRRSPSVAEDVSTVKAEHSIAPDDSVSIASFTDETSRKSTRRRRENLRSVEADEPRLKRKRDDDATTSTPKRTSYIQGTPTIPSTTPRHPPRRAGLILATRNFSRITSTLMHDITTHRLASLFAKPLTEREAPGYKDLILRPQDLKSIRGAISAGGRALTAVLEDLGDSAGTGAHIWVPESEDLMPPKGIVNGGQLEKELMRIFANAVMFNPDVVENRGLGPAFRTRRRVKTQDSIAETSSQEDQSSSTDGKFEIGVAAPVEGDVVQDTRTVAKDVQEAFAAWRAVEGERETDIAVIARAEDEVAGEDDEADEDEVKDSVEIEEEGERRSKRRKR